MLKRGIFCILSNCEKYYKYTRIIVWLYQNNLIQYFDDSVITELVKRDVIF